MDARLVKPILDANKLGRRGQRITFIFESSNAKDSDDLFLVTISDEPKTAGETPWWEKES